MDYKLEDLIVPMSKRRFEMVRIDKIRVLNPRKRDMKVFEEAAKNIDAVGQIKPVTLNERDLKKTGFYSLVCGEGRLAALLKNMRKTTLAQIVDLDRKTAYLIDLAENLARTQTTSLEHIKMIAEMKRLGVSTTVLVDITGYGKSTHQQYIHLIEHGELELLQAVEDGRISLSFAKMIANGDVTHQSIILKGFDCGIITAGNLPAVRKMLERREKGKASRPPKIETVEELVQNVRETTEEYELVDFQRKVRENRLYRMINALKAIKTDPHFVKLLKKQGVETTITLSTNYTGDGHV